MSLYAHADIVRVFEEWESSVETAYCKMWMTYFVVVLLFGGAIGVLLLEAYINYGYSEYEVASCAGYSIAVGLVFLLAMFVLRNIRKCLGPPTWREVESSLRLLHGYSDDDSVAIV